MSLAIVFRQAAEDEMVDSVSWYNAKRAGLGDDFEHEVLAACAAAVAYPDRYPIDISDVRSIPVDRFPYSIYYKVKPDRIVVISVFHQSRNLTVWQGRA